MRSPATQQRGAAANAASRLGKHSRRDVATTASPADLPRKLLEVRGIGAKTLDKLASHGVDSVDKLYRKYTEACERDTDAMISFLKVRFELRALHVGPCVGQDAGTASGVVCCKRCCSVARSVGAQHSAHELIMALIVIDATMLGDVL